VILALTLEEAELLIAICEEARDRSTWTGVWEGKEDELYNRIKELVRQHKDKAQ